jgi:hypothetical protein
VSHRRILIVALIVGSTLAAACATDPKPTVAATIPAITASLLIEPNADDPRWVRDLAVDKGIDGYELLEAATDGNLVSEWYPEYRSHLVSEILGIAPEGAAFWGVFVWNEGTAGWEPLPVGADLYSVKDGHTMAWALVEFDPDSPQLPVNLP